MYHTKLWKPLPKSLLSSSQSNISISISFECTTHNWTLLSKSAYGITIMGFIYFAMSIRNVVKKCTECNWLTIKIFLEKSLNFVCSCRMFTKPIAQWFISSNRWSEQFERTMQASTVYGFYEVPGSRGKSSVKWLGQRLSRFATLLCCLQLSLRQKVYSSVEIREKHYYNVTPVGGALSSISGIKFCFWCNLHWIIQRYLILNQTILL